MDQENRYEVRDGKLVVNGEAIPLRKGIVYAALAKAGWNGHEGPLPLKLVTEMLRLDRRVSLMAFARETGVRRVSGPLEFLERVVLIGAGATLTMDLWALLLQRFGIPSLNFALLGRWIGHLPEGKWIHGRIAEAAPVQGERLLGWSAHYSIGIGFAALLLAAFGLSWARSPSIGPALLVGVGTVVAPLFILQPALGAGIASSKTPTPVFNSLKSLATHTVFGLGLYLAALATASLIR